MYKWCWLKAEPKRWLGNGEIEQLSPLGLAHPVSRFLTTPASCRAECPFSLGTMRIFGKSYLTLEGIIYFAGRTEFIPIIYSVWAGPLWAGILIAGLWICCTKKLFRLYCSHSKGTRKAHKAGALRMKKWPYLPGAWNNRGRTLKIEYFVVLVVYGTRNAHEVLIVISKAVCSVSSTRCNPRTHNAKIAWR